MSRRDWARVAWAVYVTAIVAANWLIAHVGIPGKGTHLVPVWFGVLAPSGVYMAALAFPARDVIQRTTGRWWGLLAIVVGAVLSWWVSSPTIAIASGLTFLVSESVNFAIYSPIQRRNFPLAVALAMAGGLVVDSMLFLTLAHIPWSEALPGLIIGKVWVLLVAIPITAVLRRRPALAVAA